MTLTAFECTHVYVYRLHVCSYVYVSMKLFICTKSNVFLIYSQLYCMKSLNFHYNLKKVCHKGMRRRGRGVDHVCMDV